MFIKQDSSISSLQEAHLRPKDLQRLKDRENIFHKGNKKKVGVVIFISDKHAMNKYCNKKQWYYIIIKRKFKEENKLIRNKYVPYTKANKENIKKYKWRN